VLSILLQHKWYYHFVLSEVNYRIW